MFPIRVKTVQESDLRMLGSLARNIQRVLPVTQADIDAAAALGKGWVVWKVFEVSDPLDNMRGGTQLIIRQNSIQPGQNVRRVIFVSGPGGQTVVIRGTDYIALPDAIADSLSYVKAFGGTEQRNIPQPYTQVNYVTNTTQTAVDTGIMIDFAKNYEFEVECRATSGSWYILQSRASSSGNITGIHGATSGSTITLVIGNVTVCTSAITRTVGNKLYVKATLNAGTATLYVKDETANTEDTQTGSYGTSQPNPTAAVYLLGNAGGQYADINSDIYMARIKENGVTVMDYVPCRQVATAGFYDTVSGTFKTALTPANLSADGNTVPTPDTPMDIVSNNGVIKINSQDEIYTDGTVEKINVHGKNLINVADYQVPADSTTHSLWTGSLTGVFRLSLDTSKVTSVGLSGNRFLRITVSGSTTNIDYNQCDSIAINGTLTRIYCYGSNAYAKVKGKISLQLERGTTTTPYEPYYDGGTATTGILLKIGDTSDEQEILSGSITRKIGYRVLKGTETFGSSTAYGKSLYINGASSTWKANKNKDVLCQYFAGTSDPSGVMPEFSCFFNSSGHFYFRTNETAANFKAWLASLYAAGTPLVVFFVRATPTTESVAGQTLQVTDGDNVLEITQASLTGLELEAEYNAAVSLTIQEVEDANLDNNVTVTIQ